MSGDRRYKSWNIFDSALVKNAAGHHYWETKGLVDELIHRGETVRLFSHVDAPTADEFPGTAIVPVFSLFLYRSISNDPTWSALENFIVHNRAISYDLSKLDPSLFHDSLVLFPTVGEEQLLGIFRWLGAFPQQNGPRAALCLLPHRTEHSAGLYKTVWKDCSPALKGRIALFGRTPQLAELYRTSSGVPAHVYPYPIPEELIAAKRSFAGRPGDPMAVSFVGGARLDRGADLIPDVVRQCTGSGIRFFIQVRQGKDTTIDEQGLIAFSGLHVRVHKGPLERLDYYREMANSTVLLPYRAEDYRWRDSGVYHEAMCLDAPVLVSAGTWMAEEVTSLGNGLVIENHSAAAIVDCIARAQRQLPALKAAATRVGREARKKHGVGRCIEAVAGAFVSSGGMGA